MKSSRVARRGFALLLGVGLAGSVVVVAGGPSGQLSGGSGSAVIGRENAKQGSGGWATSAVDGILRSRSFSTGMPFNAPEDDAIGGPPTNIPNTTAALAQLAGYADSDSINQGETLAVRVSSKVGAFDYEVYRMGWYGGAGGRLMTSGQGIAAADRGVPFPVATNGIIDAQPSWPVSFTLATGPSWPSGSYLIALNAPANPALKSYVFFVVREDSRPSSILVQIPTFTYQAYNAWGGRSFYSGNSIPHGPGSRISFNRPYGAFEGAGLFFLGDFQMIQWLEREGYDVTYATSSDTDRDPGLMTNHKVFLSAFHDEYWTWSMRNNLDQWIAAGKHVAFLSANNLFWQVRLEPSAAGSPRRTIVSYRFKEIDPMATSSTPWLTTLTFRDPFINRSEKLVTGAQYDNYFNYGSSMPWVVSNADHWIYNGMGLSNGTSIPGLIGYEWDYNADPSISGVTNISNSPMAPFGVRQNATVRTFPSGAIVFNASTTYWPRFLTGDSGWPVSAPVGAMTKNLLGKMLGSTPTTVTTTAATTTTTPATTTLPTTTLPATTTTVTPNLTTTVQPTIPTTLGPTVPPTRPAASQADLPVNSVPRDSASQVSVPVTSPGRSGAPQAAKP